MRDALIQSAYSLFAKNGYDATTIVDITKHAHCSPRTFFQYFDSKEDLLFVGLGEFWDSYAKALQNRKPGVSAIRASQIWARTIGQKIIGGDSQANVINREVLNRHISAQNRGKMYSIKRMEDILTPELIKDLGSDKHATEARLIATAAAAIFSAYHTNPMLSKTDRFVYLDKTIAILEGALHAVKRPQPQASASRGSIRQTIW